MSRKRTILTAALPLMLALGAFHLRAVGPGVRLVVAPTGNEVRYRVREQLVGVSFPNDAVGRTDAVSGELYVADDGSVSGSTSHFIVDAATFRSDRDMRDGYVQRRLLETETYPTVELRPRQIRGLPLPLPTSGSATLQLIGDLTVKGVTRPTTWRVLAQFGPDGVTGSATTGFTFEDFQLTQPSVRVLLSVADSIHLEYDFHLVAESEE